MRILYNIILKCYEFVIQMAAILGNKKASQFTKGRKQWDSKLRSALKNNPENRIWFHCASLGEFEQGRPLIEKIRLEFPDAFLLLTFFSPSGYEIRKNYLGVDFVSYLPLDTRKNSKLFLDILNPNQSFFIKYEFWFYFIDELKKRGKSVYIVSANFRPNQLFFKWYGTFFRKIIQKITHIFVQDLNSIRLLQSIQVKNASVSGDTRFDRVVEISKSTNQSEKLVLFKGDNKLLIAGSTWSEDEDLIVQTYFNEKHVGYKIVIAPHEINEEHLKNIESRISTLSKKKNCFRFTEKEADSTLGIMILDTIGQLSSVYGYADITYIGGGFGKGIHNILEPAAYGKPVIFGPNYYKFREATELVKLGAAFSIIDQKEYSSVLNSLMNDPDRRIMAGRESKKYISNNIGATQIIFSFVYNRK